MIGVHAKLGESDDLVYGPLLLEAFQLLRLPGAVSEQIGDGHTRGCARQEERHGVGQAASAHATGDIASPVVVVAHEREGSAGVVSGVELADGLPVRVVKVEGRVNAVYLVIACGLRTSVGEQAVGVAKGESAVTEACVQGNAHVAGGEERPRAAFFAHGLNGKLHQLAGVALSAGTLDGGDTGDAAHLFGHTGGVAYLPQPEADA